MSHFPSGTELRTTVSTENIIDGPRQKGTASNKPVTKNSGNKTRISIGSPTGRFKCPCGKSFSSSWNFTQHAMACKVAKAKKVKIPQPVKIKSDTGSPAKGEPSMSPAKTCGYCNPIQKYRGRSITFKEYSTRVTSEEVQVSHM